MAAERRALGLPQPGYAGRTTGRCAACGAKAKGVTQTGDAPQSQLDLEETKKLEAARAKKTKGSTNYASIRQNHFPLLEMRIPDLKTQQEFVERLGELGDHAADLATTAQLLHAELDALVPSILFKTLNHKSLDVK